MNVVVVQPPLPAVSLEEAKRHMRVDWNDDDDIILAFVAAAQGHIDGPDGWLGRSIGRQTLRLAGWFGIERIALPYPPVVAITAVESAASDSPWQMVDPSGYRLDDDALIVATGAAWVRQPRHRITYQAGYDAVPAPIKAAILLMTADLYANRETVSDVPKAAVPMPTTAERLLMPFRRWV